jgi:DNA ligase (NAD+)
MPARCPSCRHALESRGPLTFCPNRYGCPAQLLGRIVHFASEGGLDIEGLGPERVTALIERGLVHSPADLFRLTEGILRTLEGFAEKSAANLVAAIQSRRRVELPRFLYALGVPGVGAATARDLADHFRSLDTLRAAGPAELRKVPGIGERTAEEIHRFFREPPVRKTIEDLAGVGVSAAAVPRPSRPTGPLANQTVVFTGTLERLARAEAEALVLSLGGRPSDSVSRKTSLVVIGVDPGSKAERARRLGVKTVDEKAFLRMVGKG